MPTKPLVPLARLERALPKEMDFESIASTNSATGAARITMCGHRADYRIAVAAVNREDTLFLACSRVTWHRAPTAIVSGNCMLRKLYDWTMSLAATRHAEKALAAVSFVESSFFPIPPDVLLIPMVLADRQRWLRLAFVCTLASVLGALLGYFIGVFLYEAVGQPILAFYGKENSFETVRVWYNRWGGWGVLFAAITPFPYKVLTIFSGAVGLNLAVFIAVSIVGRALRFFIVSWLLYHYGPPIRIFIEKHLGLLFTIFVVLLAGGFLAVKYLF